MSLSNAVHNRPLDIDVIQLGARMHYAVPVMLHRAGHLRTFYTDIWKEHAERKYGWMPKLTQHIRTRTHAELPRERVKSCDLNGIRYAYRLRGVQSLTDQTKAYLDMGSYFCEWVNKQIKTPPEVLYGFNSVVLELFTDAKYANTLKIVEQTLIPRSVERTILSEELERRKLPVEIDLHSLDYERRESAEWKAADIIVCGSEFVKQSLMLEAVPERKIRVVPYGFDPYETGYERTFSQRESLKLLFVGNGWLRKGLLYVLEAVASLDHRNIEVHVAGKSDLYDTLLEPFQSFTTIHGSVSRDEIVQLYNSCDVFVLPSLCEGSATVVYEAMSYGLPVICTPNTGSVIRHNKDGFIVSTQKVDELAFRIESFLTKPDLLKQMSQSAREWAKQFTTERYKERLLEVIEEKVR